MVKQHEIRSPKGARRLRIRRGRGDGSRRGNYSGKGMKGAKARSGGGPHSGFEGWQLPWIKGMPKKKGFNPPFRQDYAIVNLTGLEERFQGGDEINPERMAAVGLIRDLRKPVKVLGDGDISKPLTVDAHRFSAGAREKLTLAGGSARELEGLRHQGSRKGAG